MSTKVKNNTMKVTVAPLKLKNNSLYMSCPPFLYSFSINIFGTGIARHYPSVSEVN